MKDYILNPLFAIFILTVIAAGFVWIISVRDSIIKDEIHRGIDTLKSQSQQTIKDINKANGNILKSLEKVEIANERLGQNYKLTIEAKEATIQSQKEIIGMLTGGDSHPEVLFQKSKGFYLMVLGEFGIPNLGIQIVYFKDFVNTQDKALVTYLNSNIAVDNISIVHFETYPRTYPRSLHPINLNELKINLDKSISHGFDFILTSEYKKWVQRIRLVPVDGKWEVLYALEEILTRDIDKSSMSNISEIYFKVSSGYPYLLKHNGKTFGNEALYYMMDNDKRHQLSSSRLFNNGIEVNENNTTESLDINFFDDKK